MLKRSGCFTQPNGSKRNQCQFRKVKQKSLNKTNHQIIHQPKFQVFKMFFFSAQHVGSPTATHLVTTKASSQQSEPSVYLARCGGDVYLCIGGGWVVEPPKMGMSWNYPPSISYYCMFGRESL